ncbi:MAG: DUF4129 domain-containing protein [Spirochaetia bacterium]|jgi:hypothetical protein|nr:DUF4129 domain-containing protein [Spirochaetia bacterium]
MRASLIFLSAMELLKLHCLSSFLFLIAGESLPLALLSLAYIVALATDRILNRKSRRVILYFLAHLAVFAASFYLILLLTRGGSAQLGTFLPRDRQTTLSFFILLGALALYWLRGLWILRQGPEHEFIALRFDEGILVFMLCLFLAALLKLNEPMPARLAIPFFAFGILALGTSHADESQRGGFSARSRGSMIITAVIVFMVGALGLALLIPSLLEPAKVAASSLKEFSLSIVNIIAAILVWLFTRNGPPRPSEVSDLGGGAPPLAEELGQQGMPVVLMWILAGILTLVALAVLVLLVSMLIKLLAAKTRRVPSGPKGQSFLAWLGALWKALRELLGKLVRRLRRRRGLSPALEAYRRMLAAGRAGGAPRAITDTPREYALRLEAGFAAAKNRALPIVTELEKEVYGGGPGMSSSAAATGRELEKLNQLKAFFSPGRFFALRLGKILRLLRPEKRRPPAGSRGHEAEQDQKNRD